MNSYDRGFIEKCAEYGVDPYDLSDYMNSNLYKYAFSGSDVAAMEEARKATERAFRQQEDHIARQAAKKAKRVARIAGKPKLKLNTKNVMRGFDRAKKIMSKANKRNLLAALGIGTLGTIGAGLGGYGLGKHNAPEAVPEAPKSFGEKLKGLLS